MLSLDTETTGKDLYHGAKPFFVTTCHSDKPDEPMFWEWPVNPLTREVDIPEADIAEICQLLAQQDRLVGQNIKFDTQALLQGGIIDWQPYWYITEDTLIASHLLASNQPHDLTSLAIEYLGINIEPYEKALEVACKEARRLCRSRFKEWRIAAHGLPEMPSCPKSQKTKKEEKEAGWKYDSWLPKALAQELNYPEDHPWHSVLRHYANADSVITLQLWLALEQELKRRGLWAIYQERMRLVPILHDMERLGVTASGVRAEELETEYRTLSDKQCEAMKTIARQRRFNLEVPKGATPNGSLRTFCSQILKLPPVYNPKAKTEAPSLDSKIALPHYLVTLPREGDAYQFVAALAEKRSRDTALSYLDSYKRFWCPIPKIADWFLLHPSLNQTGTDTLRFTSANPNSQNFSKKQVECLACDGEGCEKCKGTGKSMRSLRYFLGPRPGREWWSLDYENIERRIPAYASGEKAAIELFEAPDEPPYFGSEHLLTAHTLYTELFEQTCKVDGGLDGRLFKKKFKDTYYQWTKNGNFAVQYQAGPKTADAAFHRPGAHHILKQKFALLEALNQRCISQAKRLGYVESMPDKSVDPTKGYPILCINSKWGAGVAPTIPLSYYVQSTAMWCTARAMVRVAEYLSQVSKERKTSYRICLQVHDELVLDCPSMANRGNLPIIRKVAKLMAQSGDDIGVPLRVSMEHNPLNWAEGEKVS